jgi:hypothetical protein
VASRDPDRSRPIVPDRTTNVFREMRPRSAHAGIDRVDSADFLDERNREA